MASISRMSGFDAGFLYMETPSMHMHTLKIAVLEPSDDNTFDSLVEKMTARLRLLPPMRRRVVPVPFALHHPVLVTQRRIDPRQHFFRHDIGGDEQRISRMNVAYSNNMFKLLLMPLWIATYVYGGKSWQVMVNANTGEVVGDRPYSAWKITLATIAGLIVLAAIITAVVLARRQ